jgi:hypothetical protein
METVNLGPWRLSAWGTQTHERLSTWGTRALESVNLGNPGSGVCQLGKPGLWRLSTWGTRATVNLGPFNLGNPDRAMETVNLGHPEPMETVNLGNTARAQYCQSANEGDYTFRMFPGCFSHVSRLSHSLSLLKQQKTYEPKYYSPGSNNNLQP